MKAKQRRTADRKLKRPATVLVSYGDMAYSDEWGYWRGTLTGDIEGEAEFREQPKNFEKDGIEYYFEDFVIRTHDGMLRGTKNGVYDLTTGDFWDHGHVTEASGRWAHLVGYLVFERATTSTPGIFPMIGHQTPFVLAPPHPTEGRDKQALISRTESVFSGERRSWSGTLTGGIQGKAQFQKSPRSYVIGDSEYFSETFTVTAQEGTIQGTEAGICDLTTGNFWACGSVTEASGSWDHVIGAGVLKWGRISRRPGEPAKAHRAPFVLVRVQAD